MPYLVLILFFASGFAALGLEVALTRSFGLVFGNTVQSGAIVTSSYFLGMAIGYYLAGKIRVRRPLIYFGLAELTVGLWALLVPTLIYWAGESTSVFAAVESKHLALLIRMIISISIMLPCTIGMGLSLPFLAAWLQEHPTISVQTLYGINVLGAFVGTIASNFFLFPTIGVSGTSIFCASISVACGLGALLVGRRQHFPHRFFSDHTEEYSSLTPTIFLASVSGFTVMLLQTLYLRLFSLVFHNSVYTFGIVLAVFIIALAMGSFLSNFLLRRNLAWSSVINLLLCTSMLILCSVTLFVQISDFQYFESGTTFYSYILGAFAFVSLIIIPPVTLCGALLPWLWQLHSPSNLKTLVTSTCAWNVFFCFVGSLFGGFFALEYLGVWWSFALAALAYLVSAVVIAIIKNEASLVLVVPMVFLILFLVVSERWTGVPEDETLLKRYDSPYGWIDVTVNDRNSNKTLRQNIHYGLGALGSTDMQRTQSLLPFAIHPAPKDILFIGLATGITAGAVVNLPSAEKITVVELIPEVIKAASFFREKNNNLLEHAKVKVLAGDGRFSLKGFPDQNFDLMVADLFVPWESQTGYLYSFEHFALASKKLRVDGIFCQWLPLWQISRKEFLIIADTFAKTFPFVSLWYGKQHKDYTAVGLIGSKSPILVNQETVQSRVESFKVHGVATSYTENYSTLIESYIGDWSPGSENTRINTDDWPIVEFEAPISAWSKGSRLKQLELEDFEREVFSKLPKNNAVRISE